MGDTGRGIWLIVGAMLVYGVAFDFFNVAGALFIDRQAPASDRSAAQGLLMMMTKGVGASVGMIVAGWVVNRFCRWEISADGQRYFMGDWSTVWWIFAGYCVTCAGGVCGMLQDKRKRPKLPDRVEIRRCIYRLRRRMSASERRTPQQAHRM